MSTGESPVNSLYDQSTPGPVGPGDELGAIRLAAGLDAEVLSQANMNDLLAAVAQVKQAGYGRVTLIIEKGQVRYIEPAIRRQISR